MPTWMAVLVGVVGGFVLLLVLLFVFVRFVLPRLLKRAVTGFATGLFAAKASALKGATLEVSRVELAEEPEWARAVEDPEELLEGPVGSMVRARQEDGTPRERVPGRWVRVLAHVTPAPPTGECNFTHWEPSELSVLPTTPKVPTLEEMADADLECQADLASPEDAEEDDDTGGKIAGPAEVEIVAWVPDGVESIRVHYYTELLGGPIAVPRVVAVE